MPSWPQDWYVFVVPLVCAGYIAAIVALGLKEDREARAIEAERKQEPHG